MPTARELRIQMEDRPGTLGKLCRALADRGVNVLAVQSFPAKKESSLHLIVDDLTAAKTILDSQSTSYSEADVAKIASPHRPGELARAASRLGDAKININYSYCGVDPQTNSPFMVFGVAEVGKAVKLLEQAAVAGTGS